MSGYVQDIDIALKYTYPKCLHKWHSIHDGLEMLFDQKTV